MGQPSTAGEEEEKMVVAEKKRTGAIFAPNLQWTPCGEFYGEISGGLYIEQGDHHLQMLVGMSYIGSLRYLHYDASGYLSGVYAYSSCVSTLDSFCCVCGTPV